MKTKKVITIGEDEFNVYHIWEIAHRMADVAISEKTRVAVLKSRKLIEKVISGGQIVYGINTGFGELQNKIINSDKLKQLQENLIRSHCVGVGEPYTTQEVRATMLVRLISLAGGYSGVRMEVIEKLVEMLNKNVVPFVPSRGSVGCSGDLAPLSHIALVMMGEGEVMVGGQRTPTKEVLEKKGINPIIFAEKEGLAFNNGTATMTGVASLNLKKAKDLLKVADVAGALTMEALRGFSGAFEDCVHKIRHHDGQRVVAKNFRELFIDSELIDSRKNDVQDSYSLRCIPQVHGAIRDVVIWCCKVIEEEINSTTDNPLVFSEFNRVISGGNFHGAPIAYAMDFLAIALTDLGSISERRIAKMMDGKNNNGLPSCLIKCKNPGLNSGLMIAQYTAAALVSENKGYSHPASVDSIPTSANQEDHVSFGSIATNKCRNVIMNLQQILSIELFCSFQALSFAEKKMGMGSKRVYDILKAVIPEVLVDRPFYVDFEKINDLINRGCFID